MVRKHLNQLQEYLFPKDFLFGACICEYQHFGNTPCDLPPIKTAKHKDYFELDFDLAKELGLSAFRTGIEWGRIEPEMGRIDPKAIEFYHTYLGTLKDKKIKIFATLHHFTNPRWIHREGGWPSKNVADRFLNYVDLVSREFRSYIDYYLVVNEPLAYAAHYLTGKLPPYRISPIESFRYIDNLSEILKHSHKIIHRNDGDAKVGITNALLLVYPNSQANPMDQLTSQLLNRINYKVLGRLNDSCDFIGVNYYAKFLTTCQGGTRAEVYPSGLREVCRKVDQILNKPIIITENGLASSQNIAKEAYLVRHLKEVHDMMTVDGLDIRGYLWWNFIHGYEWFLDYKPNFSLVDVDIGKTYRRRVTSAAKTYGKVIENGISQEMLQKYRGLDLKFEGIWDR